MLISVFLQSRNHLIRINFLKGCDNMLKRVIYLVAALWIMMICTAFAQVQSNEGDGSWQVIDVGPAENYEYAFNTATIKYDRNKDGSVNKNIIIYEERKMNMMTASNEYKYYTITDCKINKDLQSIMFGDEKFYTREGKYRWTNKPTYLAWITVKPETIGGDRFIAIVSYATAHDTELEARS